MAGFTLSVHGQQAAAPPPAAAKHGAKHPSNAQLADPKIEVRVEKLLRQMTLEEKIGQLVQYNDTGDEPAAAPAGAKPSLVDWPPSIQRPRTM